MNEQEIDYKENEARKMEEEKELQDMPLEVLLQKQADLKIENGTGLVAIEAKLDQLKELEKMIYKDVRDVLPKEIREALYQKKEILEERGKDLRSKLFNENMPIHDELERRLEEKKENIDKEKYLQMIESV